MQISTNVFFPLKAPEFVVKQYSLDGNYEGLHPLKSILNSICCTSVWQSEMKMNANFRQTCRFSIDNIAKNQMRFYELFLILPSNNGTKLVNVPLRVLNFVRGGFERNRVHL